MVPFGGTVDDDTGAVCDGLEGGGCLAVRTGCCRVEPLPQCDTGSGPCVFEDTSEPPGEIQIEGGGLGGGGCQHVVGPLGWPLWVALLAAMLRRSVWVWVALVLWPQVALAVDVVRHETLDGGPIPGLVDPRLGDPWALRFTVGGTSALDPVTLREDGESFDLVEQLDTVELGGSVQVVDWFVAGVSLPIHRMTLAGLDPQRPSGDTVLFMRVPMERRGTRHSAIEVRLDAALHPEPRRPFELPPELESFVAGSLFDTRSTLLTRGTSASLGWVTAIDTDQWWVGGRLAARLQRVQMLPGLIWGSRWEASFGVRRELGPFGLGAQVRGSAPLMLVTPTAQWPLETLGFAAWGFTPDVELQLGGGAGLSRGLGVPTVRAAGALTVRPERRDQDADGLADLRDLCPRQPEDRDGFRDADGCPDLDNDQDGLVDVEDACPVEAEVINGWLDDDGCPDELARWTVEVRAPGPLEQVTWTFDGVAWPASFATEQTVELPPGRHVVAVEVPGHRPAERVVELEEGETTTVIDLEEMRLGEVHVTLLSDEDGSLIEGGRITLDDTVHELPVTGRTFTLPSGAWSAEVEAPGYLSRLATFRVEARRSRAVAIRLDTLPPLVERPPVLFEFDSDQLTAAGLELVEALAAWLRDHPEVYLLRVEGHADAVGGSAYNLDLSQRRAESVVAALVDRAIQRDRLQPMGSGEAVAWLSLHAPPPGVDAVLAGHAVREVQFEVLVWDDRAMAARPTVSER